MDFQNELGHLKEKADLYIGKYFEQHLASSSTARAKSVEAAIRYSLCSGGNRFRPVVAMLTAKALGKDPETVLGLGVAIEFIHSYSLIHDDLPCMDDDDERRGQPSTHKAFGEGVAVLAGDVLNTEAFSVLTNIYGKNPSLCVALIKGVAEAAGIQGMAGGQGLDMEMRSLTPTVSMLEELYQRKTGALLRFSVLGSALICQASGEQTRALSVFAAALGLLFQITDDVMDFDEASDEPCMVRILGREKTIERCQSLLNQGSQAVAAFGESAKGLVLLLQEVFRRVRA